MPNYSIIHLKDLGGIFIIVENVICILDLIQGMSAISTRSVQSWTYLLRCTKEILMKIWHRNFVPVVIFYASCCKYKSPYKTLNISCAYT